MTTYQAMLSLRIRNEQCIEGLEKEIVATVTDKKLLTGTKIAILKELTEAMQEIEQNGIELEELIIKFAAENGIDPDFII